MSVHPVRCFSPHLVCVSLQALQSEGKRTRLSPQNSLKYNLVRLPVVRQLNYTSSKAKHRPDDTMFAIYKAISLSLFLLSHPRSSEISLDHYETQDIPIVRPGKQCYMFP